MVVMMSERNLEPNISSGKVIIRAAAPALGRWRSSRPTLAVIHAHLGEEPISFAQEQLEQRKDKLVLNHTYRQWRRMQKEDPTVCRLMRFQDNPKKSDDEKLRLEMETVPLWRPGHPMRASRP